MSQKTAFTISGLALLSLAIGYNSTGDEPEVKNDRPYRVLVHEGVAFVVDENTFQAWKKGEVHSFSCLHTTRKIQDPEDATKELEIPAIEFSNAVSYAQYKALRRFEVEDKLLEQMIMADLTAKTKELDLTKF